MSIWQPQDIRNGQARLLAAAKGTDDSVRACSRLDQGTRASWGLYYISVRDFAAQDPGLIFFGSLPNQLKELEDELVAWQAKIKGAGCALTLPQFDPNAEKPDPFATLKDIAKYVAIFGVAVGGAYAIGKVVELAPHPTQRIAVAKERRRLR